MVVWQMNDLLDLNPAQRSAFVKQERERASQDAWYSRVGLRRRLEQHPLPVETLNERWAREASEQEEQRRREQAERKRELAIRERRAHQIALAQAQAQNHPMNGVDWADLLREIGDAIGALTDRVEELETRLDALANGNGNGTAKQNLKKGRRATTPLPGRWPRRSPNGAMRYSQPLVTRR
jgi:hypothetical protein